MIRFILAVSTLLVVLAAGPLDAQSLRGSRASLSIQNRVARQHDFTYLRRTADVRRFVRRGLLERVRGTGDLDMGRVSFPFARPAVKSFLERLSRAYRTACGRELVVTSLTRPQTRQPRNASSRSVHPTGMAVDLRRTNHMPCRRWLESTLLYLEGRGVLEATRERYPPHYHVALFPRPYDRYAAELSDDRIRDTDTELYIVRRGDTLSSIAEHHRTTVRKLRRANNLRSSRIYAGQILRIPSGT